MICSRIVEPCPECGDTLIHQSKRGPYESSSGFGQWVHDQVGRVMYWMDVDGASYAKSTRILRIIEHKPSTGQLSDSQNEVLPYLAKALQLLAGAGIIDEQSGVFVIRSDHPHETAKVEQIRGWWGRPTWTTLEMSGDQLKSFVSGEPLRGAA